MGEIDALIEEMNRIGVYESLDRGFYQKLTVLNQERALVERMKKFLRVGEYEEEK